MPLPTWLTIPTDEHAAFAKARGLGSDQARWGELIASAQTVIGFFQDTALDDLDQLYNTDTAVPLIAASRILDSASHDESIPEIARQHLALLAAVSYGMYANFPSATATWKRILPAIHPSPIIIAVGSSSAPSLIPTFLQYVQSDHGNTETCRHFIDHFAYFLESGDSSQMSLVSQLYQRLCSTESTPFELALHESGRLCLHHSMRLSMARILHGLDELFPANYLSTLIPSGHKVFLPPQYKLLTSHNTINRTDDLIVTFPTSTGKTLIAELLLARALGRTPGTTCYITPYVALGRQVADSFSQHLPHDIRLHRFFGGYEAAADFRLGDQNVIVATPERFDSALRTSAGLVSSLRAVVFDEAHMIESGTRGVLIEGLIARLRLLRSSHPIRLILLSAVLPANETLSQWLGISGDQIAADDWKPTARRLALWRASGRLEWYQADDPVRPDGIHNTSPIGTLLLPWPEPNLYPTDLFAAQRALAPYVDTNVAYLVAYLREKYGEPILCISSTKAGTRRLARAAAIRFEETAPLPTSVSRIVGRIEDRYPRLKPLAWCLKRGVAFHNSTVPRRTSDD